MSDVRHSAVVKHGSVSSRILWIKFDEIKAAVTRKEDAWKTVLVANDEETKELCMKVYRAEKDGKVEKLKDA